MRGALIGYETFIEEWACNGSLTGTMNFVQAYDHTKIFRWSQESVPHHHITFPANRSLFHRGQKLLRRPYEFLSGINGIILPFRPYDRHLCQQGTLSKSIAPSWFPIFGKQQFFLMDLFFLSCLQPFLHFQVSRL